MIIQLHQLEKIVLIELVNYTGQSGTNVTITEPSTGVFNIEATDNNTLLSW